MSDDIPSMVYERMALVLAKSDRDLEILKIAAAELGGSKGIPGDQVLTDEDITKQRKQVKKARKWLMGMVNNRVMGAVVDSFTSVNNLRWENIDLIATIMASISGVGDDPLMSRFKADRAPAFLGTRFQRPDSFNPNALAMAISGAITDRGLDPLVEFLLDEENRRVDGLVAWSQHAETIFMLDPEGRGEWMWEAVCNATASHANPRRSRGVAARTHVRNLFEFLPSLVATIIDSFDHHFIGWSTLGHRAVMASDFELFYLPDDDEQRLMLEPSLKYSTPREAAQALAEHLALLTTGNELLASAVNA